MLAQANRKAAELKARNVEFIPGDAERLDLPHDSFDRLTCASSLVLMSDIPRKRPAPTRRQCCSAVVKKLRTSARKLATAGV